MSHYEERLQADLDSIRTRVSKLARNAESAILNSLRAVKSGSYKLAYRTILEDGRINRAHTELNKTCFRFIAIHLPTAGPLRLVESVVRTNIQLERLGDYAVTISREAVQMSRPPEGQVVRQLDLISEDALRMLDQAITAFTEENQEMARVTMKMAASFEPRMDVVYSDLIETGNDHQVKDSLAMFVIFNMVKRVADQAKNICEEALFAVSGEYKKAAHHKILFVDEDATTLGPMAVSIAQKLFPDSASYSYTGRKPSAPEAEVVSFMDQHGYDMDELKPADFDESMQNLTEYFVIVSLDKPVTSYFSKLPFHTSALEWDLESTHADGAQLEELYRGLVTNIGELIEMMTGESLQQDG